MINALKKVYGVPIQTYHGGSLRGENIQKLIQNSLEIFNIFALSLKDNKKDDCNFSFGSTYVL